MIEPQHVAFLHDGRVLVDETGTLPSFVPGWFDNGPLSGSGVGSDR